MAANIVEAGCDEAGRGCLAGPVYAAAVILPPHFYHPSLNDSKKMTKRERETLRRVIEMEAVDWAVASCSAKEIDRYNILRASIMAMHRALDKLNSVPEHLLIDGNRFYPYKEIPFDCIVGGDGKYSSIAAASVLAKSHRDEYMLSIAADYPQYGWEKNMAYPTKMHRQAIERYGVCEHHRLTFSNLIQGRIFQ